MTPMTVSREVELDPEQTFSRITDWARHAEAVPLTTIGITADGFVARTALGPFGFDDPMVVTQWDPPRSCRLEKRGRVVAGWAEITVSSHGSGSLVTWTELAHVRGVPRLFGGVERRAAQVLFGRVIDRLLAP